jgi:hypothetical protein
LPTLHSAADLDPLDQWINQVTGLYQKAALMYWKEHHCWQQLRDAGVIR